MVTRRTVLVTLPITSGGTSFYAGRNPIPISEFDANRIRSWQISPAPSGAQALTTVRLGSDATPIAGPDALQLVAQEAASDDAVIAGEYCALFPFTAASDTPTGAIRLIVVVEDSAGGCACR